MQKDTLIEKKHMQEPCKTIMKNAKLARFWLKRQILQESDRKVISCKNLARFLKDLHHQEKILARFTSLCRQKFCCNREVPIEKSARLMHSLARSCKNVCRNLASNVFSNQGTYVNRSPREY